MLKPKQITKKCKRVYPVIFNRVDSTNRIAKDLALNGAKEGTLIIAKKQTAGRGRLQKTFYSPFGGIYMSLILKPKKNLNDTVFITVAAAVAISQSIENICGKKCSIKWVNDIYIDEKKVCGILTEGCFSSDKEFPEYAILGIGINLIKPKGGFPDDISGIADAVINRRHVSNKLRAKLISDFLKRFFILYDNIEQKEYLEEYKKRSFLVGKQIEYIRPDGISHTATVLGIDDDAGLIIEENKEKKKLTAGEIKIKWRNG